MLRLAWIFTFIALLLYSFTQIDLSLTFSRASFVQAFEKAFQVVGYFNRPLSTGLFLGIVLLLFILYVVTLILIVKKKVQEREVRWIILAGAIILLFSYNAFSYDFFNYMFAAKQIVHYHVNPYQFAPWDMLGDPMLSFMHSVDKVYVYGPLSLVFSAPLYVLGFGYLLPTFYLFKAFAALSYLGCVWAIYKILKKEKPHHALFGAAFFGLNPLVLIEGLVSAHNDIPMMCLALLATWALFERKWLWSLVLLSASFLTKQVTVFLIPIFLLQLIPLVRKRVSFYWFILLCIGLQTVGGWFVLQQREMQPWYFLWLLPFIALLPISILLTITTIGVSLGLLLRYVSFLYFGNWDQMAMLRVQTTEYTPLIFLGVGILAESILWFWRKKRK